MYNAQQTFKKLQKYQFQNLTEERDWKHWSYTAYFKSYLLTLQEITEFWKRQQTLAARVQNPLLIRRSMQRSTSRREKRATFPFVCRQNNSFLWTAMSWISEKPDAQKHLRVWNYQPGFPFILEGSWKLISHLSGCKSRIHCSTSGVRN